MTTVEMGAIKFTSIKAAYETAKRKNPNLKYITFYQRLRAGENTAKAMRKPVRQYTKKVA